MGCLAVFKPAILTDNFTSFSFSPNLQNSCYKITTTRVQKFHFRRRIHHQINCYHHKNKSSSAMDNEHNPPQQAILKVISGISQFCTPYYFLFILC